ncbi:E3 ubiquitin-protein ligase RNF4-like [Pomacea canaliculata]|uniref:E3 ubiquitin-protein ligase RNF4-like n=1 Tax=Pomacea canaliculata TaxID=400727 RepID=UPI000D73B80F|nr:E3 ubiquitin-protein ligase RNF4-like [Pomacea canaliculata]XP_025095432.1 E3 ubiquitin-protein ligase RNF4-like [Pomacea canaliculata]
MSARTGLRNHPYRSHRRTNTSGTPAQGQNTRRRRHAASSASNTHINPVLDPGSCIDLTANDTIDGDIIDLTTSPSISAIDSPVVVISPVDVDNADVYSRRSPYVRRRQQNYQNEDIIDLDSELLMQGADDILPHVTRNNSTIDLDSASDDDLPNPPFEIQDARPSGSTSPQSVEPVKITCPICLDSDSQIQQSGRHLYSTVCGHIFCNSCIRRAIRTRHSCPNCRKKLTLRQIHPVFL